MSWKMSIKDAKLEKFNLEEVMTKLVEGFEQSLDLEISGVHIERWRDDEPSGCSRLRVKIKVNL